MSEEITGKEDFSGTEIIHYALLFCYNWEEKDFRTAFKDSRLKWDYYWDRLQGKIQNSDVNPTQAIVEIILNMDNTHRQMLYDYLFKVKYPDEILRKREWNKVAASHKESAKNATVYKGKKL